MEDKIYQFLEKEEGRVLHSYLDQAGVWTIGVGSTMYQSGKKVGEGETITNEEADQLRNWEVSNKMITLRSLVGSAILTDNQIVALLSFTYNEGVGALAVSSLLKTIRRNPNDTTMVSRENVVDSSVRNYMAKHSWDEVNVIRMHFMEWNKVRDKEGVKRYNESIMQRRLREAALYLGDV